MQMSKEVERWWGTVRGPGGGTLPTNTLLGREVCLFYKCFSFNNKKIRMEVCSHNYNDYKKANTQSLDQMAAGAAVLSQRCGAE